MNLESNHVVIAGGSGFLGTALTHDLHQRGYRVVVLTRRPETYSGMGQPVEWNGRTVGDWIKHVDGADAVVNLTGKSVNCRYTPENRKEIDASRVDSARVMARAIRSCNHPPAAIVQAGSLAIYGDAGDRVCTEDAPPGKGFPVETCLLWERAFNEEPTPKTRRVLLRIGFALGAGGGALTTLAKLTRWFLGGTVGGGRQYISWLHLDDLNEMFRWAIERDDIEGVYNATGPNPVTNAEFMRELRQALRRPWSPTAPEWAVKVGSLLMSTEASLALTGRRCVPQRFLELGFEFKHPRLREALRVIYNQNFAPKVAPRACHTRRA